MQKLRYDFHIKQIKRTVADIRETAKRIKSVSFANTESLKIKDPQTLSKYSETEIPEITYKQKKLLLTAYTESDFNKPEKLEKFKSETVLQKLGKFKLYQEKQKENFKTIQQNIIKTQRKLSEKLSKSMKSQTERDHSTENGKRNLISQNLIKIKHNCLKEKLSSEYEENYIREKLLKFEKKLEKSKEIHNE